MDCHEFKTSLDFTVNLGQPRIQSEILTKKKIVKIKNENFYA